MKNKIITCDDMWCTQCGNKELEVSGSDIIPIYTCIKCFNLMAPIGVFKNNELENEEQKTS